MKLFCSILLIILLTNCHLPILKEVTMQDGTKELIEYKKINDSLIIAYFDNGQIYLREELSKECKMCECITKTCFHYTKTGNLFKFSVYRNEGLIFYKFYGDSLRCGGNPITSFELGKQYYDTIPVQSNVKVDFNIVTPPNCNSVIMVGDYLDNENLKERDLEKFPIYMCRIKEGKASMVEPFNIVGDYRKCIFWAIEDTLSKDIYKGKNIMNFHVRNKN